MAGKRKRGPHNTLSMKKHGTHTPKGRTAGSLSHGGFKSPGFCLIPCQIHLGLLKSRGDEPVCVCVLCGVHEFGCVVCTCECGSMTCGIPTVAACLLGWFEARWNLVLSSNRLWLAVIKCHSLRNKPTVHICSVNSHDCHMIAEIVLIGYLRSSCPPLCSYSRPSQRS